MNLPFQNVSVKVKIVTPFVVSTLFMVFVILLVVRFYTVKNQQQVVDDLVQAKMTQINNNIERVGAKALLSVSVSAGIEAVRQAYSTYRETGDLYSSSYIIQEQFDDITAAIEQHTGNQTKIHFHLPGARSFIRCWTDKRGDDLSDFRNTILKVEETKKPVYGIETGRGGFVIRGLSPIFHDNGSYAGSVELLFPISEIFEMTTVSDKENFAAFIDKDLLRIATSLDDADASNIGQQAFQTQDYLFVESRKDNFATNLLTNEILKAGAESVARFDIDNQVISVFPIRNFDGKSEGVLVYTFDRSAFIKSLDALNLSILGSAVLFALLSILLVVFAINQSVVKPLRSMNATLVDTASQSSSSSYQLAESSNMIADGASRQAAAVEQTSASLEELSSISNITSERTSRCNALSEESKARILSSNQKIEVLKASVDRVVNATEETQKIVKTIDEIAFQTNLLALNAGVEAARAGEAGTGFAVVAEEVRALAQKSAEAARQTSDLIESSIAGVHEVSSFVQKTEQTLVEVTNYTDQINAKISVIEQSAREQVDGIENVNAAVADIDRVIQSNAASSEQNSAAAQELKSQVATVNEVVQRMKGFVGSTSDRKAYKSNTSH